jgi:hypothetical protein
LHEFNIAEQKQKLELSLWFQRSCRLLRRAPFEFLRESPACEGCPKFRNFCTPERSTEQLYSIRTDYAVGQQNWKVEVATAVRPLFIVAPKCKFPLPFGTWPMLPYHI